MYKRPAPLITVRGDEASARAALERLRASKSTIVRFERLPSRDLPADNREAVHWLLLLHGDRVADQFFRSFRVAEYDVESGPAPRLDLAPVSIAAGPLQITGVAGGVSQAGQYWSRAAATLREPVREDVKLSLRLVRPDGSVAAQDDRPLLALDTFKGTREWAAGDASAALFLLSAQPGPGWRLVLVAYDGATGRAYAPPVDLGLAIR
jgi:hypothetical protein